MSWIRASHIAGGSPKGLEPGDWTKISFQDDYPTSFVPSEDGEVEDWGAGEWRISRQLVKDFQNELEASGHKRHPGTDWFKIHPLAARCEWENFKKRHSL